jgi:hypothetical protein
LQLSQTLNCKALTQNPRALAATSLEVSSSRLTCNNYLLTLNSSLVTLFVTFLSIFGHHRWNALIPGTGLIVCFIWWSLVDSYKDLNTAKFAVIHELESQLPVALFRHEWWVCGHNRKKQDKPVEDVCVPLTHLERWIPFAFTVLYIGLGIYALFAPVDKKQEPHSPPAQHIISAAPERR